jgi:TRAP-type C4-dicarboxylate transport system substrate-binding protein
MKFIRLILPIILTLIFNFNTHAQTIKIGSIAPLRSPWDKALRELGREWNKITGGKIKLKTYAGGIVGTEEDMIRKMRIGQLGGAGFTNIGLSILYPDVGVLNIPFLFDSEEEMLFVFEKMKPIFEKEIEKIGYKVVIWSSSGWVHLFSKYQVVYPDDLKKHKLSFAGVPEMEQAWKQMGFHIVQNQLKDLMMALQSGMVNSFYLPPLLAGSGQYFALAPNMCSLKIAPILGAIVLTEKTWKKIPEEYKVKMVEATKSLSADLYTKTIKLERDVIETMKKNDLKINAVPPDGVKKWKEVSENGKNELMGKTFSKDIYNKVMGYLNEFRNKKTQNQ